MKNVDIDFSESNKVVLLKLPRVTRVAVASRLGAMMQ